jgi:hypothetical protein
MWAVNRGSPVDGQITASNPKMTYVSRGCFLAGSLVRPKVVKSAHFCPATREFVYREYRDVTSSSGMPTGSTYPTRVSGLSFVLWGSSAVEAHLCAVVFVEAFF